MKRNRLVTLAASLTAMTLLVTACSSGGTPASSGGLTTVRIAITPYLEYQPWRVAHELGIDKEQGIDLSFTKLAGPTEAIQAVARGDVDLASTCHSCSFPLFKAVPNLRDWMITDQFAGFVVVGRKGKTQTFDELSKSVGPEKAKEQILLAMKGKTFTMRRVAYEPLLVAALAQIGLTEKDVSVTDFPDDAKAALAFISGTGDYYFGSLPQEANLILAHGDQYVAVGATEVLGPAALWYSTMASTQEWLDKNPALAKKLLAVWYRTMKIMKEQPDKTMPIIMTSLNSSAASAFTQEEITFLTTQLDHFFTLDEADKFAYNPKSELYWKNSADFYAKQSTDLPGGFDMEKFILDESFFHDFQKNKELVDWINRAL